MLSTWAAALIFHENIIASVIKKQMKHYQQCYHVSAVNSTNSDNMSVDCCSRDLESDLEV